MRHLLKKITTDSFIMYCGIVESKHKCTYFYKNGAHYSNSTYKKPMTEITNEFQNVSCPGCLHKVVIAMNTKRDVLLNELTGDQDENETP